MIFITTFFFVRLCMEVTNLIIHSFNSCCNLLNCFSNKYIKAKASNCISGSQQKCKPSQIFDKSFNYSMLLPTSIIYMLVICVLLWNKWCKVISERFSGMRNRFLGTEHKLFANVFVSKLKIKTVHFIGIYINYVKAPEQISQNASMITTILTISLNLRQLTSSHI